MKLKRLTIYGFGHFHDRTFDLTDGLNFLVGPNEAGKSTLTQFITAILFGFPTKKHPELRYEPLDGSRFGGEIQFVQADVTYTVTRTAGPHGGKVTLHNDTTDLALPANNLAGLLAPVDQQLFTSVYAINEPRLGQVFAASKQELIDRLRHVGAVGSDFWLTQAHQLDQQADSRYKPQGRNPILNQQLQAHRELTDKLAKADAAYGTYWQLLQEQQDLRQQQAQTQDQLAQQRQVTVQLTQQAASWPAFAEWQRLGQLADQPVPSGFSADDATQLEQLRGQVTATEKALTADQQRVQDLQQTAQLPPLFQEYLPVAAQVDPLLTQLPAVQQAAQTQQQLATQQRDLQQRSTALETQYAVGGQMPRPFSLTTLQQVKDLQERLTTANQKRRRIQQHLNQLNERYQQQQPTRQQQRNPLADKQLIWLAVGLVVLVGSLLLPGTLFKLVGALCGVAVGYYGVFQVDSSTPASRELEDLTADIRDNQAQLREGGHLVDDLTTQLDVIGEAHGLGNVPLAQWSAAQTAIAEWERLSRQMEEQGAQLAKAKQTIADFLTAVGQVLPSLATSDFATVATQLADLQARQQASQTQSGELASLTERLRADQRAADEASHALATFLSTRNLRSVAAFYDRYQAQRERQNQAQQRTTLAQQIGPANLAALQKVADQASLTQSVQQAQTQQAQLQQTLDQATTQLATLAGQLAHLTASGTQATLRQRLANLETQMVATTQEWLVQRLTSQWISATLAAASGDRLPQIVAQASKLYGKLTENRYTEIELTATTLRVRRADGAWRNVGQLSRGTAEQLDLAVKLAFAIVMQQQVAMPLLIDDGFVNFDADRRQAAYALLTEISQTVQIIFLTADTAVERLNTGNLIRLND